MSQKYSKQVQLVIDILQNEVNGDTKSALKKMTSDYTMTWVEIHLDGKKLFPHTKRDVREDMDEAYTIKGRQYDIRNIAEGKDLIMIELIESYPDPKTKKVYRTPLVLVLEMKQGKIRTGRHYLDPTLSGKFITKKQVEKAYKNGKGSLFIVK